MLHGPPGSNFSGVISSCSLDFLRRATVLCCNWMRFKSSLCVFFFTIPITIWQLENKNVLAAVRSYAVTLPQPQRATRVIWHTFFIRCIACVFCASPKAERRELFFFLFSSYTAKNIPLTSRDLHFHLLLKAPAARKNRIS